MMDTKLRRPLTVQLQGTKPVLTVSHDTNDGIDRVRRLRLR
jgi:hypothetical protein